MHLVKYVKHSGSLPNSSLAGGTVQAAKRLYPSRLQTWNFASHVTFLRGFCEEVAWVLRGSSVSFAKF